MARIADLEAAYDGQLGCLLGWLNALPASAADRPSRLAGWTIRELVFHTTEVPAALTRPLVAGPVKDKPLSIAAYTSHWRSSAGEIVERERAGVGQQTIVELVARHSSAADDMHAALAAAGDDQVVAARRGPIRTSDLLVTRVNELVVHSLDLSASAPDLDPVAIDRSALAVSCRMLTGVLAEQVPGHTVEVRVPPYAAVQCVDGPRHTRGTPANVVEIDPVTWVELATGRTAWADALRAGTVRASGERANLAAYLPVLS